MKKKETARKSSHIISIALLIISGVLAFSSLIWLSIDGKGKLAIVAAGAIAVIGFSLREQGFLRKNWETLRRSMKRVRLNLFFMALCDVLLIASIVGMVLLVGTLLESRAELFSMNNDLYKVIETGDQALAEEMVSGLWNLLGLVLSAWLLILLVGLLLYTLFKGYAWFLASGILPTWADLYRFLFLNLIWLPACMIGLIGIAIAVKAEVAAVIIVAFVAVFIHLTAILNGVFVKKRNVGETFRTAFRIGFGKFRYFLIPYLLVVLSLFIVIQATGLLRFIPPEIMAAFMVIIILPVILALGRIYLSEVIQELS